MKRTLRLILAFALLVSVFSVVAYAMIDEPGDGSGITITMTHTDVVVRSGAGTNYSKIGTLYVGNSVVVTNWNYQKVGNYMWVQIRWNGRYGYVRGDLIP